MAKNLILAGCDTLFLHDPTPLKVLLFYFIPFPSSFLTPTPFPPLSLRLKILASTHLSQKKILASLATKPPSKTSNNSTKMPLSPSGIPLLLLLLLPLLLLLLPVLPLSLPLLPFLSWELMWLFCVLCVLGRQKCILFKILVVGLEFLW